MDDVFASCTEEAARSRMRHGVFEWEGRGTLADGHPVALEFGWQPDFDGPFAAALAAAKAAWERLRSAEAEHRRALIADILRYDGGVRVAFEEVPPVAVLLGADGSAEVAYGAFVDGEHCVRVEVSPAGEYVGWRAE